MNIHIGSCTLAMPLATHSFEYLNNQKTYRPQIFAIVHPKNLECGLEFWSITYSKKKHKRERLRYSSWREVNIFVILPFSQKSTCILHKRVKS